MSLNKPHPFISELASHLAPHSLVADIGSFKGDNGLSLAENGHLVVNVDIAGEPLADGHNRVRTLGHNVLKSYFIQGNASHLMFGDEVFDAVVSMHMLQHLPLSGASKALLEMQRVTKPKGYNAIKVYSGTPHEIAVRPKYRVFNFGELRNIYSSIGWEILQHEEEHIIPMSDEGGISSYSKIIARKPSMSEKAKQSIIRKADYYRRVDPEYYDLLINQADAL